MKPKSLLIYLVAFALVGTFYYFYEVRYQGRQNELKEANAKVFNLEMDQVQGLELKNGSETLDLVRDKPDQWRLVRPAATPADRWEVEGLARQVLEGKKERVFADPVDNLADYGLKDPGISLTWKGEGNKPAAPTLFVGDENPSGSSRYARLGDSKEVFTVGASLYYDLNKKLYDLREKALVLTPGEKIDGLVLYADGEIELKKNGIRRWDITKPTPGRADDDELQKLVYQGLKGRVNEFVAAEPGRDLGFDPPRARIKVMSAGRVEAEILVGREETSVSKEDVTKEEVKGVWVRSTQRPELMLLPERAASILLAKYEDLKDRHVLDLDRRTLSSLEIRGGQVVLKAERKDNAWKVTSPPDAASRDGDLESFLLALEDLKYSRRLDADGETVGRYGLNQPDLTVVMSAPGGGGATPALTLKQVDEQYLAVRAGDGPVGLVERAGVFSSLPREFKPLFEKDNAPNKEVK
ncbi:MAG: DUF4340 domain-containing protein [Pseudomonadota bacterium]